MPDETPRLPVTKVQAVKLYLSDCANPPENGEFMNFWRACTPEQKEAYALVSAANLGLELQRA